MATRIVVNRTIGNGAGTEIGREAKHTNEGTLRLLHNPFVSNPPAITDTTKDAPQAFRKTPRRFYDRSFRPSDAYKATMPDLQNGPASLIQGAPVAIQQVGIHGFKLPLRYRTAKGESLMLETTVSGTVSLEAFKKGINMSRIMRTFYEPARELRSRNAGDDSATLPG